MSSTISAAVVDFGTAFRELPYTEDGLRFTNMPGTSRAVVSGGSDAELVAGTNDTPIHFRASSDAPFDLLSLDIELMFRDWRIEASSGASMVIDDMGTIQFSETPGWSGINYFDIIHNPPEANGGIQVDNIEFEFTPPLPGDYNGDGAVGAADYVRWRDLFGGTSLTNEGEGISLGSVDLEDFDFWKSRFGDSLESGSGSVFHASAIPEPASVVLLALGVTVMLARHRND